MEDRESKIAEGRFSILHHLFSILTSEAMAFPFQNYPTFAFTLAEPA
jgi:hypothetical protein